MCQPRGAVAGGLIQDLDNCSVMAVDCEDRRYCFQISTPSGKPYAPCLTWVNSVGTALTERRLLAQVAMPPVLHGRGHAAGPPKDGF